MEMLNTKEKGGLGIGSLWAFNIALLYKWRWRFHTDTNGVWRNIIKSIHGVHAGLNETLIHQKGSGTWKDISKIVVNMHMQQLIPHSVIKRNIGNGENTFFWLDLWVGSHPLIVAYPRLYALEVNKSCSVTDRRVANNWVLDWFSNIRPKNSDTEVNKEIDIDSMTMEQYMDRNNEEYDRGVMKTLTNNDGGYATEFERARKERNETEKNRQSEEVKSLVGRSRNNNLEETVQRYIAESMKRQEREEEMLRNFVESTISSLKAHDIGIRNLELKVEQCTNVVRECLKKDASSHVEPSPEETKVIAADEIEPKTFSEKVKMRIEKEQLLLDELDSLPINAPLVKSIKTKTYNLKHLQGFLEAKDKLEGVNSDQDEFDLDKFLEEDEIQGAPLSNNDSSPIENFDVFIDFEESGHGIGMDDGEGRHEINSMDVIQPRMDEEDALDPPTQPSFCETGIRIHHSNPYTLQLTCKIGFADFHHFVNICSPINLMSKESYNKIFKKVIEYLGNNFLGEVKNVSVFIGTYSFLVNFMIFDDVIEFVENGLEEIILGKPFQDLSGIQIDTLNGVVWHSNNNDVTIFKMPRVVENFKHWNRKQLSRAKLLLNISNKDKENGYNYPYQKIKDFYKGCLDLGDAYKKDERVIDMLGREYTSETITGGDCPDFYVGALEV
ncbi:hypothetical protein CTI12_AA201500 [Artemisia annua]|uniref:RNA-directed DNA polymerase, eukaryota, Reverse transcriptase zinc-binding domain protein n=1 Tax=Artemisia annua TaxID=35608 RepID=A0A2U1P229_ARTAN|nr:hypothetical protein CTI12_AA201500 [Artemisia annua]